MPLRRKPDVTGQEIQEAQRLAAEQEKEFAEALADPRKALALLGRRWPKDWGRVAGDYTAEKERKALRAAQRRCAEMLQEVKAQLASLANRK